MANNRMWLKHKPTGEQVLLAKFYPSGGWGVQPDIEPKLQAAMISADFSVAQVRENNRVIAMSGNPFDGPFKAHSSDVNGEVWELVYD